MDWWRKRENSNCKKQDYNSGDSNHQCQEKRSRKRNRDQSDEEGEFKSATFGNCYIGLYPPYDFSTFQLQMSDQDSSGNKDCSNAASSQSSFSHRQSAGDDDDDDGARSNQLLDLLEDEIHPGQFRMSDNQSVIQVGSDVWASDSFLKSFRSCRLQYEKTPLKIVRAREQYMYDETNNGYMDCVNSVAHVGHCHPAVVEAVTHAMGALEGTCGWEIDLSHLKYPSKLKAALSNHYDTFLFCNSGSEAVDLSIQLARLYTNGTDAVVVDNAFHGSIDSVYSLSPKVSKEQTDWVHVVPMPDMYRGAYQRDDPLAVEKYIADARHLLQKSQVNGKKVACLIAEPMLTIPGCIIPPAVWLQEMYKMIREIGGLCIADEVQTGLGRVGTHLWAFEAQGVVPDIIVIGKQIGNGYPMAAVVTSREIAAVLGDRIKEYQCTTAMDAVGCAVLDIVHQDQLMTSARNVGQFLKDQLIMLKKKHEYIGDIRGIGLVLGIEIVWSKSSRKPSREITEQIVFRMKEENVLLANEGQDRNILMLLPPMCFSQENALFLVQKLDKVLTELPIINIVNDLVTGLPTISSAHVADTRDVRLGIFQPQDEDDEDNRSSQQDSMDLEYAQHCYQDLD